jgi:hypothetical protein
MVLGQGRKQRAVAEACVREHVDRVQETWRIAATQEMQSADTCSPEGAGECISQNGINVQVIRSYS